MPPPEAGPQLVAARWLERAQGDLAAARALLAAPGAPAWTAGFHLQQAVEKALKEAEAQAGEQEESG